MSCVFVVQVLASVNLLGHFKVDFAIFDTTLAAYPRFILHILTVFDAELTSLIL